MVLDIVMNKIFCLGDGFAHGHIWPEWPQILAALLPEHTIIPITGIGAGNEFLINGLLTQNIANSAVIFQWAIPNRFDKILQDHQWQDIIKNDPVYFFNTVERNHIKWWLSSGSSTKQIQDYHKFYLQSLQANIRLLDQQKLIDTYVRYHKCNYIKISTEEQDAYSLQSRFANIRGNQVQPSPEVHFCYLDEIIVPLLNVNIDHNRKTKLLYSIKNTTWIPYDPDRESIWQDILSSLD